MESRQQLIYSVFMSAIELKKIMDSTGKTDIDIAASTKLNPSTIARYLKGDRVHRSTEATLERWVKEHSKNSDGQAVA